MVELRIGGRLLGREVLAPRESWIVDHPWPDGSVAYVELAAFDRVAGTPRELLVVARPR